MEQKNFSLRLKGKTAVLIDWANVHGWSSSLKKEVDPQKLFDYLKTYSQIKDISLYFGQDKNPKSEKFLNEMEQIGFRVVTKEVKYIPVSLDTSHFNSLYKEIKESLSTVRNLGVNEVEKILAVLNRKVLRRKCDFDIEIAMDVYKFLDQYNTFTFFSGDGDFAPLLNFLAGKG